VARLLAKEGTRLKKKERPHFLNGQTILSFLEMKVNTRSFNGAVDYCTPSRISFLFFCSPCCC